jgi:microcystin-dependent protein
MADTFVAEIRIFGFNFAPNGWAQCSGQLLPISQNTALFSLLGTYYGGDGKSTFALPNLNGGVPIHVGSNQPGPGLSTYDLGEVGGVENVTLLMSEIPSHNHNLNAVAAGATTASPAGGIFATPNWVSGTTRGVSQAYAASAPDTQLSGAISPNGSSLPHNNIMPSLTLLYCIALQGVYPPRP